MLGNFLQAHSWTGSERVLNRNDKCQLIFVNQFNCESRILHWHGDNAKINFAVEYGLERARAFRANNAEADSKELFPELSENRRQNIKARSLVRADRNSSSR